MNFTAIDVETANPDLASICQIGVVEFRDGVVVSEWDRLVDPEDDFDGMNISIHGIEERDVRGQPTWPILYPEVSALLADRTVVSHTAFDRSSLRRVCEKYELDPIQCNWLDSARVVRRTWSELSTSGYGLKNVAKKLGITFHHHNAVEDARAAGEILVQAIRHSQIPIGDWIRRSHQAISGNESVGREGNAEGPLFGEVIVLTGALSMPRHEAADLAAKAGCEVASTVKKTTTLLVVGDQDLRKLAGAEKSSKHRKAEELIAQGHEIRILSESDFERLLEFERR